MWFRYSIEFLATLVMVAGAGSIIYGVLKGAIAMSIRTIQFMAIAIILPAIMVLAIEGALTRDSAAALIGVIVGYLIAGISKGDAS